MNGKLTEPLASDETFCQKPWCFVVRIRPSSATSYLDTIPPTFYGKHISVKKVASVTTASRFHTLTEMDTPLGKSYARVTTDKHTSTTRFSGEVNLISGWIYAYI